TNKLSSLSFINCSLRSLRLALVSRCLPHSLPSLVQGSGAPAWLSTAARDSPRPRPSIWGVRASRVESAYFVVTRRRRTCLLAPPQHCGARFPTLTPLGEHRPPLRTVGSPSTARWLAAASPTAGARGQATCNAGGRFATRQ